MPEEQEEKESPFRIIFKMFISNVIESREWSVVVEQQEDIIIIIIVIVTLFNPCLYARVCCLVTVSCVHGC